MLILQKRKVTIEKLESFDRMKILSGCLSKEGKGQDFDSHPLVMLKVDVPASPKRKVTIQSLILSSVKRCLVVAY